MKKLVLSLMLFGLCACSDGDLQIDTLDFDDISVDNCDDLTQTGANILFKTSSNEALILELPSGVFNNGNSTTVAVETIRTIPSGSQLTYRLFSDDVSNGYFCSDIPPATPIVTEDIEAQAGTVTISSIAVNDSTEFSHTITLDDITLINANGDRVTDLTVSEFGTVTTTIAN